MKFELNLEEQLIKEQLALGRKIRSEKQLVIDGRVYEFIFPKHYKACEFIQFATDMGEGVVRMGDKRFEMMSIELEKMTIFEKSTLDKLGNHWEEYQSDYMTWLGGFLVAIASPFQKS